ncbi:plexin domain-containing protein 2 [Cydia strobilella]|uniref:plexin domain-containing protein 2 n=1 Tax=Cydia strobilella TaxID=1100964 RepID=UPI0030077E40
MDFFNKKVSVLKLAAAVLLCLHLSSPVKATWEYSTHENGLDFVPYRQKRDAPSPPPPAAPEPAPAAPTAPKTADAPTPTNATAEDSNRTTNLTAPTTTTTIPVSVTKIPLLGVNGSGIYKGNTSVPRVSDPILADDNITTTNFEQQEVIIEAQKNINNLTYDNHIFYNSTFIGNVTFFQEHWNNITRPKADIHAVLSNSHRRATTLKLSFLFPFYGHPLHNITVATGGFLYTGEHVHNWLAATQYIAPLMANFDTTLTIDSCVKMYDDGEKFTALWENVNLREDKTKNFTFAATLYKNGDITFAYKDIPIPVQLINDNEHPVKVGISDAYLTDRMMFYVRRKTIYEYHRVTYKGHNITSNTLLKMIALPTCLQYNTCEECTNHETEFNCSWCEALKKCSSGTDRNKQDWVLRACDKTQIVNDSQCPASPNPQHNGTDVTGTVYVTDGEPSRHEAVINTQPEVVPSGQAVKAPAPAPPAGNSPVGAAVSAIAIIALVAALAAWILYAFKNPHTRSGQLLIKYRPSQWSWRRGEARYTAATIHM